MNNDTVTGNAQPAAAREPTICHICGKPLSQPGELYCSASHGNAPMPSQEPPWVVAGAQLAEPWERAAKAIEVGGRPLAPVDVRCIENACRQHAAALAQERDALRDENIRLRLAIAQSPDHQSPVMIQAKQIERLTAERDRLRAALAHVEYRWRSHFGSETEAMVRAALRAPEKDGGA